ncbi:asparaginase [Lichenihabitans sp. Uapishka_5]|uniref:asparaginase n=1 Tax=Lichenihabitans sp. Uapishka_5 TaxID=3037302 RepID=UPI0029E7D528|nr:asparaginase [Lichenihabitans sp. Uapishka_5]MDX7951587.1 asparaginase [Lichenihabitans sp. Uapishka_5]
MTNPVLIEVTRGTTVESRHRGTFALVDGAGRVVASAGDIDAPVFPRSAVKALQALPLVENGWADRYGLAPAELALACASHSGEAIHTETALGTLRKLGLDEAALECGAHWPTARTAAAALIRDDRAPSALHNNCSGKHAGFLCLACGLKAEPRGYVGREHRVQRTVKDALVAAYGHDLDEATSGTDGCSIPTYAVPLRHLARAFARFGSGEAWPRERAAAAARLRSAVAAYPLLVAGTGRLDTDLMAHFGERVFTKTGAEGVFCAALPERGWGLALKCDDGATRASEAILLHLLEAAIAWTPDDRAALATRHDPVMRNWNGIEVGRLRPTEAIGAALAGVA